MGVLKKLMRYVVFSLLTQLAREVGWTQAVLIVLGIVLGLAITGTVAGILARVSLNVANYLIRARPRTPNQTKGLVVLSILSTLGALFALLEMPYSYYMILRILVCLTSLVALANARKIRLELWQWGFGVIAALYNPFLPVHLGDKDLWTLLNFAALAMFWVGEYKITMALVKGSVPVKDRVQEWSLKVPRE